MLRIKRLFYVPGIISLIGLSVALPLFYKKNSPVKEHCLSLFVPSDSNDKNSFAYNFSKYNLEREIRKKKQLKFILNDNKKENKRKIDVIRYEALKLKYTEDTSTVILITLTDEVNYGEFISIIDMCDADGHKRYIPWDNKFVIFGEWPQKKVERSGFDCFLCYDVVIIKQPPPKPNFADLVTEEIKHYYTPKGLCIFLGWVGLLISFLYYRKKKSILKKH